MENHETIHAILGIVCKKKKGRRKKGNIIEFDLDKMEYIIPKRFVNELIFIADDCVLDFERGVGIMNYKDNPVVFGIPKVKSGSIVFMEAIKDGEDEKLLINEKEVFNNKVKYKKCEEKDIYRYVNIETPCFATVRIFEKILDKKERLAAKEDILNNLKT